MSAWALGRRLFCWPARRPGAIDGERTEGFFIAFLASMVRSGRDTSLPKPSLVGDDQMAAARVGAAADINRPFAAVS
jgi:hypothetical protein